MTPGESPRACESVKIKHQNTCTSVRRVQTDLVSDLTFSGTIKLCKVEIVRKLSCVTINFPLQ